MGAPTMPQTVELPDDLADVLTDEASRLGLSLPDYAVCLLTSARPLAASVRSGADLVAFWRAEGVVSSRPDIPDSQSEARRLRECSRFTTAPRRVRRPKPIELLPVFVTLFPPAHGALLDCARRTTDEDVLWDIAMADYGQGADEMFALLRAIRITGDLSLPGPFLLGEVLELTRWYDPKSPNSLTPDCVDLRAHQARFFSCAALLTRGEHIAFNQTVEVCLKSAIELGDEMCESLGKFLTFQLSEVPQQQEPLMLALALLTLTAHYTPQRVSESDLLMVTNWVLAEEARDPGQISWYPWEIPRHWMRDDLEDVALRIATPELRTNLQLCGMLCDNV